MYIIARIPLSMYHCCKLGQAGHPTLVSFPPWSSITGLEELVSGVKISFKKCDCFDSHCFVLFLYICYFILSSLAFLFYVSILIIFYICSPNCQLISCNTSENVSPVKQDTEVSLRHRGSSKEPAFWISPGNS